MNDDARNGYPASGSSVLRPTPGGRKRGASAVRSDETEYAGPAVIAAGRSSADRNRLTSAAAPLLALASRLRNTGNHADSAELFRQLIDEVKTFEAAATHAGYSADVVRAASYSLCTLIDEVVLYTPWGAQSVWVNQTLLNLFHKEGWGGEKFFAIVERVLQQPGGNLDLLELLYLCMALGLEGKYRVQAGGRARLETLQNDVANTIRRYRGSYERELSPHWRGVQDLRPKLTRYIPLWAACATGIGIAVLVYLGFLMALNERAGPIEQAVAALGANLPPIVERQGFIEPPRDLTLSGLLENESRAGLLEIQRDAGAETVIIREGLFASGSGEVSPARRELLESVARALSRVSGAILITGHTDDRPIRSLRFPTNNHLSERRAEAVREILAEWIEPQRLTAEARGETEPLVPNDSPENRAINRRVEITLFALPTRE